MSQNTAEARPLRSNEPGIRHEDFCARHEENTTAIGKHSGQWTLLLWILGLGIGSMATIAASAYYAQQTSMNTIAASVHSIDKMVTAYIAGHTIEAQEGMRRVIILEKQMVVLDSRVDQLERN